MCKLVKEILYYIKNPLPHYTRKPLTMDGKPSITIEGNPLLIKNTFKNTLY